MLNRLEAGLSHFSLAERLMPGSHITWVLKVWQARTLGLLERWAESDAAIDEALSLNPTWLPSHIHKALICVQLGQDAAARRHIGIARSLGMELAQAERLWRRALPNSPRLEADIAIIRALYAATEPGA